MTTTTTAPTDGRKVWQKSAYDVKDQVKETATDVGYLRKNDSRVDIVSTIDKGNSSQAFSFSNMSDAKVKLSDAGANGLRVQVLNQAGWVVADSKSGQGQASQNYTAMTNGTYDMKQGKYFVTVQRAPNAPTTSQVNYNLQLSEGSTVKNDYITDVVAKPASISRQQTVSSLMQVAPNALSGSNLLTASGADLFGVGGTDIFGQKTSS